MNELQELKAVPDEASTATVGDHDIEIERLHEIADGAWGDNPMYRGLARDLVAALAKAEGRAND